MGERRGHPVSAVFVGLLTPVLALAGTAAAIAFWMPGAACRRRLLEDRAGGSAPLEALPGAGAAAGAPEGQPPKSNSKRTEFS
jgi:hypothetical protein